MNINELKKRLNIDTSKLDVLDEIALNVFEARVKKGLSQKELADLIGTKQSVISRLESRGSNPSMTLLLKIAKALKIELHSPFHNSDVILSTDVSLNEVKLKGMKVRKLQEFNLCYKH